MLPFERFEAWKACHAFVLHVHRVSAAWPAHERYGLTAQVRRAAGSAAANIAEGSAKRGRREFRRYLDISVGSLSEAGYWLILARDLDYLSREDWEEADALRNHAGRVTWGLAQSLDRGGRGK